MRVFTPLRSRNDIFYLDTDRLLLRVVRPESAAGIANYLLRNRSFHKPFHPFQPDEYFTVEEQRQYILSDIRAFRNDERFPFWISHRDRPEWIIGRLSFSGVVRGALLSCTVGYHMDMEETGMGYMKEALALGCSYVFREQGLHRIQADVMTHNTPSIRTVLSCGFRQQGLNEKYMCIDGKWQDHLCFAKINDSES